MNNQHFARIHISLPDSREILIAEPVQLASESSEKSSAHNFHPNTYLDCLETIIKFGETYGISSTRYKAVKTDSECESDSESYLSSFVDRESENCQESNDDLSLAISEGFYVVEIENFNTNRLKRLRNECEDADELEKIIEKLPEKKKSFNGRTVEVLKEISEYVKKEKIDEKNVFKRVAARIGVGIDKIMKILKQEELFSLKKEVNEVFVRSFSLCKKKVKEIGKKGVIWDDEANRIFEETEKKLKEFVEANNELASFSGKREELIVFEEMKTKYLGEFMEMKERKRNKVDIVIEIESQENNLQPKSGRVFLEIVEFQFDDFSVN